MGFVRKATIISTGGLARAGGMKGKSKKERNAEANEKLAKIEAKRFKAEQKVAKEEEKATKAEQRAASTVQTSVAGTTQSVQPAPTSPLVAPAQGPPSGWYLDPHGLRVQRWWDGTKWTDVTQPVPVQEAGVPPAMDIASEREPSIAPPGNLMPEIEVPAGISPAVAVPHGDLANEGTGGGQLADRVPNEVKKVEDDAQSPQFGEVACNSETVTFVTRLWGQDNTHQVKMAKVGKKPVKIKLGKSGMLDMTVAPGVLTMKGLTLEQCASSLKKIAAFKPELSVDVSSTELADALGAAGLAIVVQVVS